MGMETKTHVYGLGLIRTHTQLMMEEEEDRFLSLGADSESLPIPTRFLDGQGSTRTLTDETGAVVATYVYDSYGNLVVSTGTASTAYRYVGNQRYRAEADLGLIWIGCRHYDPEVGRCTTEDTWLGTPGRTQSVNRYAYCEGDPANFTDATGRSVDWWELVNGVANAVCCYLMWLVWSVPGKWILFYGCCMSGTSSVESVELVDEGPSLGGRGGAPISPVPSDPVGPDYTDPNNPDPTQWQLPSAY